MDVITAIRQRRSHRAFQARPVEDEKINLIIEAACWAPSPGNSQPWEFHLISNQESRDKLYELSETARVRKSIELHGFSYVRPLPFQTESEDETTLSDPFKGYSFAFLKNVPVIIAVAGLPGSQAASTASEASVDGYKYACAAAIQNMLLAAQSQGLGSLWFTFFDQNLIRNLLQISLEKYVVALVCIGYPVAEPVSPGRHPIQSKIRHYDE